MTDPLRFPPPALPILGQPFTLKAWIPHVLITCHCAAKEPVLIVGAGTVAQCPACGKSYQLATLMFNAQQQRAEIQLAVGIAAPALVTQ